MVRKSHHTYTHESLNVTEIQQIKIFKEESLGFLESFLVLKIYSLSHITLPNNWENSGELGL